MWLQSCKKSHPRIALSPACILQKHLFWQTGISSCLLLTNLPVFQPPTPPTPHPSAVHCTAAPPASLSKLLSSIFSSAGSYSHCGSAAFRCRLAYLVQATDRQANRPNWMDAASPASRGDPNSSLRIPAQPSLLCHTQTQKQTEQSLVFKLSVLVFFALFSYPAFQLLLLSLSITQSVWLHTARAPTHNTVRGLCGSAAEVEFIISLRV